MERKEGVSRGLWGMQSGQGGVNTVGEGLSSRVKDSRLWITLLSSLCSSYMPISLS